jgi:hypothetical protein
MKGRLKLMNIKCGFHCTHNCGNPRNFEFLELGKKMPIKFKPNNNLNPCKTMFKVTDKITAFIKTNTSE